MSKFNKFGKQQKAASSIVVIRFLAKFKTTRYWIYKGKKKVISPLKPHNSNMLYIVYWNGNDVKYFLDAQILLLRFCEKRWQRMISILLLVHYLV